MVKAIGNIIDRSMNLIGLIFESDNNPEKKKVVQRVPLNAIPNGFENSQFKVVGGRVQLKNNFQFNSLDKMEVADGKGNYIEFGNNMAVIERIRKDGETVGFKVQFEGNVQLNLKTNDLAIRAAYFKPLNFVVRNINGKNVICGKDGQLMHNLKTTDIVTKSKSNHNQNGNRVTKDIKPIEEYEAVNGYDLDIIGIINFVKENGGAILSLPNGEIKSFNSKGMQTGEFREDTGLGIAYPTPKFAESKINVTLTFRKPGYAMSENGKTYETFITTANCIFENGECKRDTLSVLLNKNAATELSKHVEMSKCSEGTLEHVANRAYKFSWGFGRDISNMEIYVISLKKIGLISDENRKKYVLSNNDIIEECKKTYELKLMSKYLSNSGALIQGLKKRLGAKEYARLSKSVFYQFNNCDVNELDEIRKAGISIQTGEFNRTLNKKDKEKSGDEVEISYTYSGLDYKKITGKQLVEMAKINDQSCATEYMINTINAIESMSDEEKIAKAVELNSILEPEIAGINERMWLHKASMFIEGRKKYIHQHDKADWIPDENSKVKTANVYVNVKTDNKLQLRFKGVSI